MTSGHEIQQVFDRRLVRHRRQRYGAAAPAFLFDMALEELTDRLSSVHHRFESICALNTVPGLKEAIERSGQAGRLFQMDCVASLLKDSRVSRFVADEELLPLGPGQLACIVSILSLQLVNDLPGTLVQIRRSLKPDGLFLAALLGAGSLQELREVFLQAESELSDGVFPRVAPFPDVRDLGDLLQRAGFVLPVADVEKITVRYGDFLALLHDLRHLGWANALQHRAKNFLRRDILRRAGELYHQQFCDPDGRLRATFQMVWLTGWSPDNTKDR